MRRYFAEIGRPRQCDLNGLPTPPRSWHGRAAGALSSVGRASRLHREGRRFEPVSAHQRELEACRGHRLNRAIRRHASRHPLGVEACASGTKR